MCLESQEQCLQCSRLCSRDDAWRTYIYSLYALVDNRSEDPNTASCERLFRSKSTPDILAYRDCSIHFRIAALTVLLLRSIRSAALKYRNLFI
jgi:hypothetical protein